MRLLGWSQRRLAAEAGVRQYDLRQLAPLHRSELGAGVESAVTAFAVIRIETEGLSSLVSVVPSSPNELRAVLSELRAFQARRQADSEAGPGLGDQLRHQG